MSVYADAEDVGSLKEAFRMGSPAFLLNPPAETAGDTGADERHTIVNILAALEGSTLEKVVAASTYGVQPGDAFGDLSTLWEFEERLRAQPIPAEINRGYLLRSLKGWRIQTSMRANFIGTSSATLANVIRCPAGAR